MQCTRVIRTIRPGFFRRPFSASTAIKSSWSTGPSPPRLPKEEQEIFERLQKQSTGAFSTPKQPEQDTEKHKDVDVAAESAELGNATVRSGEADKMLEQLRERARLAAKGDGEELHPNVRRGAAPEFDGDTNPQTGEVGGPKNDPLRWRGDWSYNGRVTDF
ncbi:Succinate dehydrogenase assembly factor 4, mitochondrial [Fulvia fulva]|uniref:Succinate dehydrogenase assembly factor 4, mitochondrial n=1 Tax=Passalora fulva TaxID=5499 RepID=A0A9Q8P3Y3_PASFU|nr:Succinate dehydrogenase assembly factor 4, mitochondrial [Fulvia fulva]KAK4636248.1 Succinate dehydrogenase assembly factor 4, mitochondrial [Fulvia fulva]KAK4637746.1 Succinate dehydrogenase assembly factor 4, mitochondrial [Fulvia fulva]UJO12167.1 Succinate dehydrogenase assembly factor 4, mitochondrial [Fulvia fulva]WPV08383.1 Succinate dehydrogenase assembly factor 4, mitochondrial [Fulvia fulva]WPV25338.1 Succinate dehydrogenase assembly factor 4, mitochondrial [Fulvia fulva]